MCDIYFSMTFRFLPSRVASQAITKAIKQQFLHPWPSWGAIPGKDKEHFWERFKVMCSNLYIHVHYDLHYVFHNVIIMLIVSVVVESAVGTRA